MFSQPTLIQFKVISPCPVTTGLDKKSLSIFLINFIYILKGCDKAFREPFFLQAEQPQSSQPFSAGNVLRHSDHFCGLPQDLLQQVHVCHVLRAPELDAGVPGGSYPSGAERQNPLPCLAPHAAGDTAQGTAVLLFYQCTLPSHVQFFFHQHPCVLLLRATLNDFIPSL